MAADNDSEPSGAARLWSVVKNLPRHVWYKYKALGLRGKVHSTQLASAIHLLIFVQLIVWSLIAFYTALGTFFGIVGADKIAQTMYNVAQKISHLQFGWLILVAAMSTSITHVLLPATFISHDHICSCHIIPAMYGIHDHCHPVRLCIRHEGILRRQCRNTPRIRGDLCCAALAI